MTKIPTISRLQVPVYILGGQQFQHNYMFCTCIVYCIMFVLFVNVALTCVYVLLIKSLEQLKNVFASVIKCIASARSVLFQWFVSVRGIDICVPVLLYLLYILSLYWIIPWSFGFTKLDLFTVQIKTFNHISFNNYIFNRK